MTPTEVDMVTGGGARVAITAVELVDVQWQVFGVCEGDTPLYETQTALTGGVGADAGG